MKCFACGTEPTEEWRECKCGGTRLPLVRVDSACSIPLRDWLAGQCRRDPDVMLVSCFSARLAASMCYKRADDMLAAREQGDR